MTIATLPAAAEILAAATPEALNRAICRKSLAEFMRYFWSEIDPAPYSHSWHIDAMCLHLEAVARGQITRLIINIPPRHMKSSIVSVAFPAWVWAQHRGEFPISGPQVRFLTLSYADTLAVRDSVKTRRLIKSPKFQALFGDGFTLTTDQDAKHRYDNTQGGQRIATSLSGSNTGEGGNILILDDPHNVKDGESELMRTGVLEIWDQVLQTRLNDPANDAMIIVMQRVHHQDLVGHILSSPGAEDWDLLRIPARYEVDTDLPSRSSIGFVDPRRTEGELLWPDHIDEATMQRWEASLLEYGTAGQLQQRPTPRSGGLIKRHWLKILDGQPGKAGRQRFRYWDLAATETRAGADPDYTAGALVSADPDEGYVIEDMVRVRQTPGQVERIIRATAEADGHAVSIYMEEEPGSSGKSAVAHYRRDILTGFTFRGVRTTGAKELRIDRLAALAEGGAVRLQRGPWNGAFVAEAVAYPRGAHDDQLDAAAGAMIAMSARKLPSISRDAIGV